MQEKINDRVPTVCVLGKDGRTHAISQRLSQLGCRVRCLSQVASEQQDKDDKDSIRNAKTVILPTPAFRDDGCVYGTDPPIGAAELFDILQKGSTIYGGRIPATIMHRAKEAGIFPIDYMAMEEVQLRNAVPSAEGAIMLAMQELDVTLDGADVAVFGYGRIGRALTWRLQSWGAAVSVAARKPADLVRISLDHAAPISIPPEGITSLEQNFRVIFNTVPARIFSSEFLSTLSRETLLIELASAPGGWSPEQAAAYGLHVRYAPGLPGIYAPRSAGILIADALYPLICKEVARE